MTTVSELIDTLSQARRHWADTIMDKGGHCPCCDRWGKVYKYRITEVQAKALLWMCANTDSDSSWIRMSETAPRWIVRSPTYALLKWWGLVQQHPAIVDEDADKKFSGYWRVTPLGFQFARGEIQVAKHIMIYNDTLVNMSDETWSIQDCFGKKFSYSEVMQEVWADA